MKSVRWGILGTASIARRQVIPAIQVSGNGTVTAVASRDRQRASDFASELDIPIACGSYAELVHSADIDAVYIPLTNDLHLPWILEAIKAGKHVLCEKPLALNADEVATIQAAREGTGLFVMEGISSHFHPVHRRVQELMAQDLIGELHLLRISLAGNFSQRPNDFRWIKELGGGGLLDLGGYCVYTARQILHTEPTAVVATGTFDEQTDIDTNMAMMLTYNEPVTVLIDCGILSTIRNRYELIGTRGKIVVQTPFGNSTETRKLTAYDFHSNILAEETITTHQIKVQMETVSRSILEQKAPPIPLTESIQTMKILDACMASARNGGSLISMS